MEITKWYVDVSSKKSKKKSRGESRDPEAMAVDKSTDVDAEPATEKKKEHKTCQEQEAVTLTANGANGNEYEQNWTAKMKNKKNREVTEDGDAEMTF